jgi:hypothetical protein
MFADKGGTTKEVLASLCSLHRFAMSQCSATTPLVVWQWEDRRIPTSDGLRAP